MPSHFSTIGFPVQTQEDMNKFVLTAANAGIKTVADHGVYIQWQEKNGAELWVQADNEKKIIGVNPHFSGKAKMEVGLVNNVSRKNDSELDGAYYGWADPTDENPQSGVFPFVFDSPNFYLNTINFLKKVSVQLAGFAHEVTVYKNEEAFQKAQTPPAFAPESFIPSGLFSPGGGETTPPQAHAIFTGRVIQSSVLKNSFTKMKYHWALVRTLGGEIDVVIDSSLVNGQINAGNILSGSFWLSGRIIAE